MPPEKMSIRRRDSRVGPNAAITAVELHDGEVRVCRSGSREAERQHTDCESESLHITPRVAPSAASPVLAGGSKRQELPIERFAPVMPHGVVLLPHPAPQTHPRVFPPGWHGVAKVRVRLAPLYDPTRFR